MVELLQHDTLPMPLKFPLLRRDDHIKLSGIAKLVRAALGEVRWELIGTNLKPDSGVPLRN